MPLLLGRHWQQKEIQVGYATLYEAVLNLLGSTGTVLPFGDYHHGLSNAGTFRTAGAEQAVFTWSEQPVSFDTSFDHGLARCYQGIMPVVSFNGVDEEADTPDADVWSRGNGAVDSPFSVGAWIKSGTGTILSKYQDNVSLVREWRFDINAGIFALRLTDASVAQDTWRGNSNALVSSGFSFVVATYSGVGGAAAANGISLYRNGVPDNGTANNNAGYVAMENTAAMLTLAARMEPDNLFSGSMAGGPMGPFYTQKVLSSDEVLRLYEAGRRALGL